MQNIDEVLKKINDIFIDVLENEDIQVKYETQSQDIEEWDSLNHISLVVAIEKSFNIKFTAQEIQNFKNVGEMCKSILEKLK